MTTITGVEGSLWWGYRVVARVREWAIAGRSLTATVVETNFGVSQRPLTFVVPTQVGTWRWPVETLQVTGASLTATLGPRE